MKTYLKRILDSFLLLIITFFVCLVLLFLNLFSFNKTIDELSKKIYHSLAEAFAKTV